MLVNANINARNGIHNNNMKQIVVRINMMMNINPTRKDIMSQMTIFEKFMYDIIT
jgi:hypothetical protein